MRSGAFDSRRNPARGKQDGEPATIGVPSGPNHGALRESPAGGAEQTAQSAGLPGALPPSLILSRICS